MEGYKILVSIIMEGQWMNGNRKKKKKEKESRLIKW